MKLPPRAVAVGRSRWCLCARRMSSVSVPAIDRLSSIFIPSYSEAPSPSSSSSTKSGHAHLLRAGFLRQSSAGVFTFLPLGLRVLAKLERIIDEEIRRIGGQKLSLPTLLTVDAWEMSGRLRSTGAEIFHVQDRRKTKYILAPTHEEEITTLIASSVSSHKQLPLRLYQIGRKHRDELRPRGGLLRGKELLMKDLYTFDINEEAALRTYKDVCEAYTKILTRIGLPYVKAEADTGNIGGTRSHEFHYISEAGEDTLLACESCEYAANIERATSIPNPSQQTPQPITSLSPAIASIIPSGLHPLISTTDLYMGVSSDNKTSVLILLRRGDTLSPSKVKKHPSLNEVDLNMLGKVALNRAGDLAHNAPCLTIAIDLAVGKIDHSVRGDETGTKGALVNPTILTDDFREAQVGEGCPSCNMDESISRRNVLVARKAIEVGHAFYLGTRYSMPLNATFRSAQNRDEHLVMGCYGIGVSRIIGAAAETCKDDKGLIWPTIATV
ncbi:proline---tRNA ligase [Synchytrium endobioticum]|uniref:Probable proline--tRNA ligase, mitochondrial n=1 Tax=Synchytrium endobioticum TaxID=286115 RepID=A0A507CW97_9FUNG|nr:proline---tRNA ligase [Synchytrium endobioticum]